MLFGLDLPLHRVRVVERLERLERVDGMQIHNGLKGGVFLVHKASSLFECDSDESALSSETALVEGIESNSSWKR